MKIFLATSADELNLKNYSGTEYSFIDLTDNKKTLDFIAKSGGKEIRINEKFSDSGYVQKLVDEYLALIRKISKENNNIFWWSTFTSSKNRFMTDTFESLCRFYAVIEELEQRKHNNLTIIAPPGILRSIELYLSEKNIDYKRKKSRSPKYIEKTKYLLNSIKNYTIFILITWKRIIICNIKLKNKIKTNLEDISADPYVIRTWIYERSFSDDGKYKDSFFGILPDYISEKKQVIIIGGILGNYKKICQRISESKTINIIPQEYFLNFKDPLNSIRIIRKNKILLSKKTEFLGAEASEIINYELKKEYSNRNILESFQFSYFIENMLKKISPTEFITTYENNPWEKVCFIRLREFSPKTSIIGYQHSVLSQFSLNMFFGKDELSFTPTPDRVITVGNVTRDILIRVGNYDKNMVFAGCGLRFTHLFSIRKKDRISNHRTVLITPEGIPEESAKICNFVFKALKDVPNIKVIIRAHPALPFDKFSGDLDFKLESAPHFEISDKPSVIDDLNRSDIVIYRGSTLALEAVKTGLCAIYIDLEDLIPVDPLFGLNDLKWKVKTPDDAKMAVNAAFSLDNEEYSKKFLAAAEYLEDYFLEVTKEKMDLFIK